MTASTSTRFAICTSSFGWYDKSAVHHAKRIDGGRLHRSIDAAGRAFAALNRATRRYHGNTAYHPGQILATEDGGETFRKLSDLEDFDSYTYD